MSSLPHFLQVNGTSALENTLGDLNLRVAPVWHPRQLTLVVMMFKLSPNLYCHKYTD